MRYDNPRQARAEEGVLRLLALDESLFGKEPPLEEADFSSPLLWRFFAALWRQRAEGGIRLAALDGQFSSDELGHLTDLLQKTESTGHEAREKALGDYLRIVRQESEKRRSPEEDPLAAAMRKHSQKADTERQI